MLCRRVKQYHHSKSIKQQHRFQHRDSDNFDFEDCSSLSGTAGTDDTAKVLFKDCSGEPPEGKTKCLCHGIEKKLIASWCWSYCSNSWAVIVLARTFKVTKDLWLQLSDIASVKAADVEFLFLLVRSAVSPREEGQVPPWGAFDALISQSSLPLKRVRFLQVIPTPGTNCTTVYSAMKSFQNVHILVCLWWLTG